MVSRRMHHLTTKFKISLIQVLYFPTKSPYLKCHNDDKVKVKRNKYRTFLPWWLSSRSRNRRNLSRCLRRGCPGQCPSPTQDSCRFSRWRPCLLPDLWQRRGSLWGLLSVIISALNMQFSREFTYTLSVFSWTKHRKSPNSRSNKKSRDNLQNCYPHFCWGWWGCERSRRGEWRSNNCSGGG